MDGWLVTWKEIAAYVKVKDKRTVKGWVKNYGFPVYKRPDGVPVAIPRQVDLWLARFNELKEK